ncbi:MAG: phospho-N-acetylmuramoyl-pentapeptide-transferase [Oscillospiraceae bacterium]|nr:phospho-N-acetylmuramoyl-pentapeptide-transferase [Oscillospiraceae bacterium]
MILSVIVTAAAAFLLSWLIGFRLVPWLRALKLGQVINDIGPTWHKYKEGTPTMGGLMFITGTVIASVGGFLMLNKLSDPVLSASMDVEWKRLVINLVCCLAFALIGFDDDYHKILNHQNMGLTAMQKVILQILVSAAYLIAMHFWGDCSTAIWLPVLGDVEFGILYYPLLIFSIVGIVNAVNLTDGVDGLAASATMVTAVGFMVISSLLNNPGDLIFSTAVGASLIGFLYWNIKPAKVFMGDTGSMFLGGAVVAMSFGCKREFLMLVSGILFVIEAFSDIIQTCYFKLTHGKRIFKMAPIHHHFEMSGWSEEKIVFVFSLISLAGNLLSIYMTMLS